MQLLYTKKISECNAVAVYQHILTRVYSYFVNFDEITWHIWFDPINPIFIIPAITFVSSFLVDTVDYDVMTDPLSGDSIGTDQQCKASLFGCFFEQMIIMWRHCNESGLYMCDETNKGKNFDAIELIWFTGPLIVSNFKDYRFNCNWSAQIL